MRRIAVSTSYSGQQSLRTPSQIRNATAGGIKPVLAIGFRIRNPGIWTLNDGLQTTRRQSQPGDSASATFLPLLPLTQKMPICREK